MPVTELADVGRAIRTRLRESTTLTHADYVGSTTNITIGWPRNRENQITVPEFTEWIVIEPNRGGAGDIGLGQREERVDIFAYGRDNERCKKIQRAINAFLIPRYDRVPSSFTRNNCRINFILEEGGPNTLVDPDAANWPYTIQTYIVNYCGAPTT